MPVMSAIEGTFPQPPVLPKEESPMSALATPAQRPRRGVLPGVLTGIGLTLVATVTPFVDRAGGQVLAEHLRHGYPTYTTDRIDRAVTTWLVILGAVGAIGIAGWATTVWVLRVGQRRGGRIALSLLATASFALVAAAAVSAALVKDTSGEVGLAPALGAIGLLHVVAGAIGVVVLWRRR